MTTVGKTEGATRPVVPAVLQAAAPVVERRAVAAARGSRVWQEGAGEAIPRNTVMSPDLTKLSIQTQLWQTRLEHEGIGCRAGVGCGSEEN